jgi:hypothetical protein
MSSISSVLSLPSEKLSHHGVNLRNAGAEVTIVSGPLERQTIFRMISPEPIIPVYSIPGGVFLS